MIPRIWTRKCWKAFRKIAAIICFMFLILLYEYMKQSVKDVQHAQSIIFLETSSKSILSTREACVLESAALHNPDATVTILSITKLNTTCTHMRTLNGIANLNMKLLNMDELFNGTPLDRWHTMGQLRNSKFPTYHLSDAGRLALIWKFGGVYLDTDALVIREIKGLQNAVSITRSGTIANGVLIFERLSPFLFVCMEEFAQNYRTDEWAYQGPELVTRMMHKFCNATELGGFINKPDSCQGVRILPQQYFFPLAWQQWMVLLRSKNLGRLSISDSFSVHFFNFLTHNSTIRPGSGVLLDILAKSHCPQIYQTMKENNAI